MKKIFSIFIALTILLGITATSLSSANFINAQKQVDIIMPQSSGISNTQPMIDLNEAEKTTLNNLLIECPSGLFVYTGINGQTVIACLIDGVYGKLFNSLGQQVFEIDIDVENDNDNNNDNDNDDNNNNNKDRDNKPDRDCLFNPSLPKCASDDGECPDGFFQNEDGNCVPDHREGCPNGYHSVDDDETGKCIKNSKGCPDGMEFRPDGKTCTYIEEEEQPQEEEQPTIPTVDDETNTEILNNIDDMEAGGTVSNTEQEQEDDNNSLDSDEGNNISVENTNNDDEENERNN